MTQKDREGNTAEVVCASMSVQRAASATAKRPNRMAAQARRRDHLWKSLQPYGFDIAARNNPMKQFVTEVVILDRYRQYRSYTVQYTARKDVQV